MPFRPAPRPLRILPVACGLGGPEAAARGCAAGAQALIEAGLPQSVGRRGVSWQLSPVVIPPKLPRREALAALCRDLAGQVETAIRAGELPLVLGGDHAIAAGTWRGASRPLSGPLGLLWIDAHLDAHTPLDSPSGNWHGMPLAALLGAGQEGFTRIPGPGPDARHIALVGARSFEKSELCQLFARHVCVFGMSAIRHKSLPVVVNEALARVRLGSSGWGMSLDLDALDPTEAPAVSTPAAGGISAAALGEALRGLARDVRLSALEMVEYDPERDRDGRTAARAIAILEALYG